MRYKLFLLVFLLFATVQPALGAINTADYSISDSEINKQLKIGKFGEHLLTIENKKDSLIKTQFSLSGNISKYIRVEKSELRIEPGMSKSVKILFFADSFGNFNGTLTLSGDIKESIALSLNVGDTAGVPVSAISLRVTPLQKRVYIKDTLRYKIDVQNVLLDTKFNVTLHYSIDYMGAKTTYIVNKTFLKETEVIELDKAQTLVKKFEIPSFLKQGEYVISVEAKYLGLSSSSSSRFFVIEPVWDYLIFGIIAVRWLALSSTVLAIVGIGFLVYRRKMASKKRYKGKVDFSSLPQKGERNLFLGKIAETNVNAYFELDALSIHTLIAGSTGGGKTVSAEVLIEEALLNGVSVIVFDPTAQWSGFLRKNVNPKMFALYPKFGMKKKDARAFDGNVHQILDAREVIDIKKYMSGGEIHVFAINRLAPKDSDILVANTIRQVFKANLPEASHLKTIIIFDEVHRLLPKFGGSGQGFIQIERGAREFRKWGVGLILISQVLTDFMGETKANINTEIQMRTRDEGDLNRIKDKYGSYMLQSLIKSATGVGMIENSNYNSGNPYFVAFRPLFHEHARLSDEELENYNKYNSIVEDIEFQIDQLGENGVDTFDLKLELKMAFDKVKQGSFNMVDIYLEGLTPRVKAEFDKLGITPKKRKVELVSEDELSEEFELAKREKEKFEKEHPDEAKKQAAEVVKAKEFDLPELKLKNGVTVATLQELIDSINTMDDPTYANHVSAEENFFADWIEKADKEFAEKIRKGKDKADTIAIMEDGMFG